MDIVVGHEGPVVWDGEGLNPGRRYLWRCMVCGHTVCLNLTIMDGEGE